MAVDTEERNIVNSWKDEWLDRNDVIQREAQLGQSVQNATRRSKLEGLLGEDFGGGSLGKGNGGGSSSTGEDVILDIADISLVEVT